MVSNSDLNAKREPGCWAVLADKKYYHVGNSCVKRTLRRHEWQSIEGVLMIPPATYPQRWKNDFAMLRYLREETNIPIPPLQCLFEDDGAFYHCTEYVEGVSMTELNEEGKQVVMKELSQYLLTMQSLRSDFPGVPGESLICPPQRVTRDNWKIHSCWRPRQEKGEYVLCHNDFAQHNVIVDEVTLKVKAIIDWEFGGFWPKWFEQLFWKRPGPSTISEGENDDVERCRKWLIDHCEEVEMKHLSAKQPYQGIESFDCLRNI